jgi:hypothetical protein
MLIELFIFFEFVTIGLFITAFFTKQEILWALTAVLSGVLMFTSYNIEIHGYQFNTSTQIYELSMISYSFIYLVGINMLFMSLALLLGLFDLFDKYGIKFSSWKRKKDKNF